MMPSLTLADDGMPAPNTVGISVLAKGSSTVLTQQELGALPMLSVDGGQVFIQMTPALHETNPSTYVVTIPDYYSFKNVSSAGNNYTSAKVSSNTTNNPKAKDNQLTITIPKPANPSQPQLVSASFTIALNRSSITDAQMDEWEAKSWNPNKGTTTFSITKQNQRTVTADLKATFSFVMPDEKSPYLLSSATDVNRGQNWGLNPHGFQSPSYSLKFDYPGRLHAYYFITDPFVTGPKTLKNVTIVLPKGLHFTDEMATEDRTLSADQRTLTLNQSPAADGAGKISVSSLRFLPDAEYIDKANPMKRFDSGTKLPVTLTVNYNDGTSPTGTATFTINYTEEDKVDLKPVVGTDRVTKQSLPSYVDDKNNQHVLYDVATGGEANITQGANLFGGARNDRSNEGWSLPTVKTPPDDGAGMTTELTFDSQLKVHSLKVNSAHNTGTQYGVGGHVVRSYTVYSDVNTAGVTTTNDDTSTNRDLTIAASEGESITKIVVTWDEFVYVGAGEFFGANNSNYPDDEAINRHSGFDNLFKELKYDAPATDEARVLLPIKAVMKDAGGTQMAEATNNILVNGTADPTFVVTRETSVESAEDVLQMQYYKAGNTYSDGSEQLAYSFGIKDEEVGGDTVILGSLQNSAFVNKGDQKSFGGYFTNGKVHLHQIMGDGKWTATVRYITTEDWKNNPGQHVGDGEENYPPKETTIKIPAFTGTQDINLMDGLPANSQIVDFTFTHAGALDITSMNGDPEDPAVDKVFYDVFIDALTHNPITGMAFYSDAVNFGYAEKSVGTQVYTKIENTADLGKRHSAENFMTQSGVSGVAVYLKGAEYIAPYQVKVDTSSTSIRQGAISDMVAKVSYFSKGNHWGTGADPKARLVVQPGWTAYLKVSADAAKYLGFQPGSGSIEGVTDPQSQIVEIGDARYIKITYRGTDPVMKNSVSSGANKDFYEPVNIAWKAYALPSTPTTKDLKIVDSGWLDIAGHSEYQYTLDGSAYTAAIESGGGRAWNSGMPGPANQTFRTLTTGSVVQDNPLGLHNGFAVTERAWAMKIPAMTIRPNEDVIHGLTLNPGIDGHGYQNQIQTVLPSQEGSERLSLTLSAGEAALDNLDVTFKLPRAGETQTVGGETYNEQVTQYLTGAITQVVKPSKSGSSQMQVSYSVDGGNTFVAGSEITEWSAVTHIHITDKYLAAKDVEQLVFPLTTKDAKDKTGIASSGDAIWPVAASLGGSQSQTTRVATFKYAGYSISPDFCHFCVV